MFHLPDTSGLANDVYASIRAICAADSSFNFQTGGFSYIFLHLPVDTPEKPQPFEPFRRASQRIEHVHWVIEAIREHVPAKYTLPGGHVNVRRNKPANLGVVIPCRQVVQPGFGIVVVAPVAERVISAQ